MPVRALYVRASEDELRAFLADTSRLRTLDVGALLADGRALNLGRGWEELGCLLEGGITTPEVGPTVGEHAIVADEDRELWSYVAKARVAVIAAELAGITQAAFFDLYQVGDDGTADRPLQEQTGEWADRAERLFGKLERLAAHYVAASERGEAMLVRLARSEE